jgi:hypothetical protein
MHKHPEIEQTWVLGAARYRPKAVPSLGSACGQLRLSFTAPENSGYPLDERAGNHFAQRQLRRGAETSQNIVTGRNCLLAAPERAERHPLVDGVRLVGGGLWPAI